MGNLFSRNPNPNGGGESELNQQRRAPNNDDLNNLVVSFSCPDADGIGNDATFVCCSKCWNNAMASLSNNFVKCPICLRNAMEYMPMATECGHIFCSLCIQTVLMNKTECPVCRGTVSKSRLREILNWI